MLLKLTLFATMAGLASCASYQGTQDTNEITTDATSNEISNQMASQSNTTQEVATTTDDSSRLPYGSYLEFPEDPSVGSCFAKVQVPGKYAYKSEKVLVQPERKIISTVPAKYGMGTKEITTREASSQIRVIPATYKQVTENIMVSPEKRVLKAIPATYRTVTEKVMIKPERKVWKVGREWKAGSVATKYGKSGEIRCLVKLPAVYQTVTKKIVDQPARTTEVLVPAIYRTIAKNIIDQPAKSVEVQIPAQTRSVEVREMIEGAKSIERIVPAVYRNKSYKVTTQEPYEMWSAILCRTNDNTTKVKELQQKLKDLGYTSVDVDGIIGPSTHRAVKHYQTKRLSKSYYDGRITYDTLKSLQLL